MNRRLIESHLLSNATPGNLGKEKTPAERSANAFDHGKHGRHGMWERRAGVFFPSVSSVSSVVKLVPLASLRLGALALKRA